MLKLLDSFLLICQTERGLSVNTIASYRADLVYFLDFIKNSPIDKKNIRRYLEDLYNRGIKRSSYLRKISSLGRFVEFLVEKKVITENVMVEIKRPKREKKLPKFLTPEEVEILIDTAYKDNKFGIRMTLIIEFLYASGMRISELLSLKLENINTTEKLIKIKGKGNKERLVILRNKTLNLINEYLPIRKSFVADCDNKYLFCSRGKTGHLTREQVGMELKKVALLANFDPARVSPHVLRHSFATNLCKKKVNLRVIQELLGHASINTTSIYIENLDSEVINFVEENHPLARKPID